MNVAHTTDKQTAPRNQEEARARTESTPPDSTRAHDHTTEGRAGKLGRQTQTDKTAHAHTRADDVHQAGGTSFRDS